MTDEQIKVFSDCGEAEMPVDEACLIAGCTESEFFELDAAVIAYRKGQLETKLRIRQGVTKLAKEGVPSAIKIYFEKIGGSVDLAESVRELSDEPEGQDSEDGQAEEDGDGEDNETKE